PPQPATGSAILVPELQGLEPHSKSRSTPLFKHRFTRSDKPIYRVSQNSPPCPLQPASGLLLGNGCGYFGLSAPNNHNHYPIPAPQARGICQKRRLHRPALTEHLRCRTLCLYRMRTIIILRPVEERADIHGRFIKCKCACGTEDGT